MKDVKVESPNNVDKDDTNIGFEYTTHSYCDSWCYSNWKSQKYLEENGSKKVLNDETREF